MEKLVVGIDLGTVNTCVATYTGHEIKMIALNNQRIIPSCVAYQPTNKTVYVGHSAIKKPFVFYDSKRFIGRAFTENFVKNIYNNYSFRIVEGDDNNVVFETGKDMTIRKKPEDVSLEILKYIKSEIVKKLNVSQIEAVITVPAYFTHKQRSLTKKSAEDAGIKVLRLLNEPTAAALSYYHKGNKKPTKALVFDIGGGTFDVSIVMVNRSGLKVLCTYGNSLLGGRNFDEAVTNYFIKKLEKNKTMLDSKKIKNLRKVVQIMKEVLSQQTEIEQCISIDDDNEETISLTREEFERINTNNFKECIDIINKCLSNNNILKDTINGILLVGGSSKIPKFEELLKINFNGKKIRKDLDPDEAVAQGAAICAYYLANPTIENKFTTLDVNPFSLGIKSQFDEMEILIPKNSKLPCKVAKSFLTTRNNQESVVIEIFEGECRYIKYNNCLGTMKIRNLPNGKVGEVIVEVTMEIDESGVLKVQAKVGDQVQECHLDVQCIGTEIKQNKRNVAEDEMFSRFVTLKQQSYMLCTAYLNGKGTNEITNQLKNFIATIERVEFEQNDDLIDCFCKTLAVIGEQNRKSCADLLLRLKELWISYCDARFE